MNLIGKHKWIPAFAGMTGCPPDMVIGGVRGFVGHKEWWATELPTLRVFR